MERINREALFSDETEDYRHPCEADAGQEVIFISGRSVTVQTLFI